LKRLAILGSTGSIGQSTLSIVEQFPERYQVAALAAGATSTKPLRRPSLAAALVSLATEELAGELAARLRQAGVSGIEVVYGTEGTVACATLPEADFVVSAIVGVAGLEATHAAILAGKPVGLANKECMVAAGEILTAAARERNVPILPIDSEHNAVHQCLRVGAHDEVKTIWLTASGGPFRQLPLDQFAEHHARAGAQAPHLGDGPAHHHRLGHHAEQGPGGHRGLPALRRDRPARCGSRSIPNPRFTRWWSMWTARSWRRSRSPICGCPFCMRWPGRSGRPPRSPSTWPRCAIWTLSRPISSASPACGWPLRRRKRAERIASP
jgi:hypothetical protein